MNTLREHEN